MTGTNCTSAKLPHVLSSERAVVSLRRARAIAPADRLYGRPVGRHDTANSERQVERVRDLRRAVAGVAIVDAIFTGQAGEGDPEPR